MERLPNLGRGLLSCLSYSNCMNRVVNIGVRTYASRNKHKIFGGAYTVYTPDKHMGMIDEQEEAASNKELREEGLKIIRENIPKLKEEIKEKFSFDVRFDIEAVHGDFEYFFQADNKESMKDWIVSTDADRHHGKSSATFSVSPSNKALFKGVMRSDIPQDGKTKKLGFCNVRSPYNMKSFERRVQYNWAMYTHLLFRIRGDGRTYMINIHPYREFDVGWMDMYQYPLYTRGGPYWQFVKIPFTNFFLSAVGRMQDKQEMVNLEKVNCLSINAMDYYGAFQLEIDYIALFHDKNHDEETHLYELYEKHPLEM